MDCLEIEQDDFRGYPFLTVAVLYQSNNVDNPCMATELTYHRFIVENATSLYKTFTGQLVNGVFFTSPDGKGAIIEIVDGEVRPYNLLGLNLDTCSPVPGDPINNIMTYQAEPFHSDIYGGYAYVTYPSAEVVVKYEIGESTVNGVINGVLFCGQLDKTDYGMSGEEEYLCTPTWIKIDPVSTNIIIFNNGIYKTFKEFDINGNYVRTWSDINPSSPSTTNLGYDTLTENGVSAKSMPINKSGLVGRCTFSLLWGDTDEIVIYNKFWMVESLDFRTINGRKTIIACVWQQASDGDNKCVNYVLIEKTTKTDTYNCSSHELPGHSGVIAFDSARGEHYTSISCTIFESNQSNNVVLHQITPRADSDRDGVYWQLFSIQYTMSASDAVTLSGITKTKLGQFSHTPTLSGFFFGIKATAILRFSSSSRRTSINFIASGRDTVYTGVDPNNHLKFGYESGEKKTKNIREGIKVALEVVGVALLGALAVAALVSVIALVVSRSFRASVSGALNDIINAPRSIHGRYNGMYSGLEKLHAVFTVISAAVVAALVVAGLVKLFRFISTGSWNKKSFYEGKTPLGAKRRSGEMQALIQSSAEIGVNTAHTYGSTVRTAERLVKHIPAYFNVDADGLDDSVFYGVQNSSSPKSDQFYVHGQYNTYLMFKVMPGITQSALSDTPYDLYVPSYEYTE